MYSEYEQYEEHPNFKIVQIYDGFQVFFVDSLGLHQESFGMYSHYWKAEKEARKMQRYADAEAF